MKKLVSVVFVVVCLSLFVLPVSAKGTGVLAPANSVMDNVTGNIGTLYIKDLDINARAFIDSFINGDKNYEVGFTPKEVYFRKYKTDLKGKFKYTTDALLSNSLVIADCVSFDIFTGLPISNSITSFSCSPSVAYRPFLVGFNPFLSAGYSMTNYNYIWTPVDNSPTGTYKVIFDDTEDKENNGLVDWLKNFWDNLLKFFKNLFVPPEGYFQKWFENIQSAFNAKMGGLGKLFEYIGTSFETLKNGTHKGSSIVIQLPPNILYSGYSGVKADVIAPVLSPMFKWLRSILTAIIIVFTSIVCIKKVIALVKN